MAQWVEALRRQLPVTRQWIYMNTGTSGPVPEPALEAEAQAARAMSEAGPGREATVRAGEARLETIRQELARFLGTSPERLSLTQSTSDGIAKVVAGLPWRPGDEVITSELEHASGILPFAYLRDRAGVRVRLLRPRDGVCLTVDELREALTPRTRLVCMSHVSYSTGARLPVEAAAEMVQQHGALLLVDGAQSAGVLPVNLEALGADAYAVPGQKWLLGPEGTGVLAITPRAQEWVAPTSLAWASVDHGDGPAHPLAYRLKPSARRYELATMSLPLFEGLRASVAILDQVGATAVWERVASLATRLKEGLAARPGVELITPLEADRSAGLVTFKLRGVPAPEAARLLTERYRVVGRWVPRPEAVRLSVHLFNTEDEVERVLEAIDELVAGGRRER
ncbi:MULTISPECIES: aminotransferase class V-fold PLP-dependent enzyme [Limnochorda]|uniref:aminotransferase class V-fold PLP-dependent enzyme n=1 Tax=Limnochorda TaxID=1676651 RepID=UPI0017F60B82|nr:aminotransferase class V-fold PLP-dependent enzyme [Limnochorda pilosa]MBO2485646.1 hypothetical protein [Bacillota bacterium]MBO2519148.1 hypothetical protein [Bacillota bacterium]NMA70701.1 aminotransferase class V-fold PLP-dependent enzyme [Bacillota bacterium]